jgi:hypothetical protein
MAVTRGGFCSSSSVESMTFSSYVGMICARRDGRTERAVSTRIAAAPAGACLREARQRGGVDGEGVRVLPGVGFVALVRVLPLLLALNQSADRHCARHSGGWRSGVCGAGAMLAKEKGERVARLSVEH